MQAVAIPLSSYCGGKLEATQADCLAVATAEPSARSSLWQRLLDCCISVLIKCEENSNARRRRWECIEELHRNFTIWSRLCLCAEAKSAESVPGSAGDLTVRIDVDAFPGLDTGGSVECAEQDFTLSAAALVPLGLAFTAVTVTPVLAVENAASTGVSD